MRDAAPLRSQPPAELLLVGFSTRALAESALLAGFRPCTVDFFGDLDQKRRVPNLALGRDLGRAYSAGEAVRAASRIPARMAAYAADLENSPEAAALLARGRELLGNGPSVLRGVRDPAALFAAFATAGIPTPATILPGRKRVGRAARAASFGGRSRWLRKPRSGGGGRGIVLLDRPRLPGPREILQEWLEGPALSLAFLADGVRVRPLALSAHVEEREAFGAPPFGYAGSLSRVPPGLDELSVREQAQRAAERVTRAFALRGWNGMDFIVRNGEVVPLEINPRHTSSMELWDGPETRLFAAHAAACRGIVGGSWLPCPAEVRGKAILFARRTIAVGDTTRWLEASGSGLLSRDGSQHGGARARERPWPARPVADIPYPGDRIERGQPICTLYSSGASTAECLANLRELARIIELELHP